MRVCLGHPLGAPAALCSAAMHAMCDPSLPTPTPPAPRRGHRPRRRHEGRAAPGPQARGEGAGTCKPPAGVPATASGTLCAALQPKVSVTPRGLPRHPSPGVHRLVLCRARHRRVRHRGLRHQPGPPRQPDGRSHALVGAPGQGGKAEAFCRRHTLHAIVLCVRTQLTCSPLPSTPPFCLCSFLYHSLTGRVSGRLYM